MKKEILQQFIDYNGKYLIGHRYTKSFRSSSDDTWEAVFIAPDVSRDYWIEDIGKMSFDEVAKFADEEIRTIIHLGNNYSPFQYGIRRKDFIDLKEVTCKPMDLIVKCYNENINDYYKVIEAMKSLTTPLGDNK